MPMKLNVGLSRKIGEANYGSRGASVNVELELDSSLIAEPPRLQEKIRQVFNLARASIAEELNGNSAAPASGNGQHEHHGNGANGTNGPNGSTGGNGNAPARRNGSRSATQSQIKALYAITRDRGMDLKSLLQDRYRVHRPEDLSIKDASALIDNLKNGE